jgi:hypothetical protein
MIKIAHEAPISIFSQVSKKTDYSYALVHLFEENEKYLKLFQEELKQGREVILDNSIFELGEAFDKNKYVKWIKKLKPTWYIIPDALENSSLTISQARDWIREYTDLPGKSIGVVQGKTYWELKTCYSFLDEVANVDMIAISFDYSYYEDSVPHSNKLLSWMYGRIKLLGDLRRDGVLNENKPHHLLGCALPQEGIAYRDNYDFIYSMDTSNPVVHAIKNIKYNCEGLLSKESQKLYELINTPAENIDMSLVDFNINGFRSFWNKNKL